MLHKLAQGTQSNPCPADCILGGQLRRRSSFDGSVHLRRGQPQVCRKRRIPWCVLLIGNQRKPHQDQ
jgi:hypothetical protein